MTLLFDLTGRLSLALAWLARLLIGGLVVLVVTDVAVRNLGYRPLAWAISVSEYILLYVTFLPMPYLVRIKGHVFVEFLRGFLPPAARAALERAVYALCLGLCLYLGWVAFDSLLSAIERGTFETRTFDMPKWAVFLPMVVGFWLSALEWLRFLAGQDSLYALPPAERERI
jgi:TRAP-type C4-dicarboxylate transport system permease small subunit